MTYRSFQTLCIDTSRENSSSDYPLWEVSRAVDTITAVLKPGRVLLLFASKKNDTVIAKCNSIIDVSMIHQQAVEGGVAPTTCLIKYWFDWLFTHTYRSAL